MPTDEYHEEFDLLFEDRPSGDKYKPGDVIHPRVYESTPKVAYDRTINDPTSPYTFCTDELHQKTSETFPGKSDAQIYFERLSVVCSSNLSQLTSQREVFKFIPSPNETLRDIFTSLYPSKKPYQAFPDFFEIKLYTNRMSDKAPRVFGFVGHASILHILCYDPFHKVFGKTGKM